jgi:hypothetical protein
MRSHWNNKIYIMSTFQILMFHLIETIRERILIKPDTILCACVLNTEYSHKYQLQSKLYRSDIVFVVYP